jgi:Mn2+/Fe2+ NRAMP family transporter
MSLNFLRVGWCSFLYRFLSSQIHFGYPRARRFCSLWRRGAFGWPATLEAKAPDAVGFYGIIAAATIIGFGLGFTSLDPIKMLIWSAVLNGIVAVPIMAVMMTIISKQSLMGHFKAKPWLVGFGWGGTALMAAAVIALVWSSLS